MSVTPTTQSAPTLLDISADNWRLAIVVGLVVSVLAVAALPAAISFWIVGAMAALIAAAFVVNAYRRRYYGGHRYGFVCQPGTTFIGEDGRRHICQ